MSTTAPVVGIIANPFSASDIRRLVSAANTLALADRANSVLRILAALAATGIDQVVMMPDRRGLVSLLERNLQRARAHSGQRWPQLHYADITVAGNIDDTLQATEVMLAQGVAAIIVLGGDGTHRAVASRCGQIPIAGSSTGTNNAFPELREPTLTGLATGLYASGRVPDGVACRHNKVIHIDVDHGRRREIALVDVVVSGESHIGARALWQADQLSELFVTFAEADAIGLSSIAGLLQPVARDEPHGLWVQLARSDREASCRVRAPIAPGLIETVGIRHWQLLPAGQTIVLAAAAAGSIALDGEREITFSEHNHVSLCLQTDALRTIDVSRTLRYAAQHGLLRLPQPKSH